MKHIGLSFVVPVFYQITRGTVVFFSAFFSELFLNRHFEKYK